MQAASPLDDRDGTRSGQAGGLTGGLVHASVPCLRRRCLSASPARTANSIAGAESRGVRKRACVRELA